MTCCLSLPSPCVSAMLVVVFPSPALVGVIAVTITSLPSAFDGKSIEDRQLHLAAVAAVGHQFVGKNAGGGGDIADRQKFGGIGNLDR